MTNNEQQVSEEHFDEQAMQAAMVTAMLQGASVEQTEQIKKLTEQALQNDLFEEDEPTTDTKTRTKAKKKSTDTKENKTSVYEVPYRKIFDKLKQNEQVEISLSSHDIHYKEQLWDIPERKATYNFKLVTIQKTAVELAEKMAVAKGKSNKEIALEKKKAELGAVRYMTIVSFDNIPYRAKEIGYVRVYQTKSGSLGTQLLLKKESMESNNISYKKAKTQIVAVLKNIIME